MIPKDSNLIVAGSPNLGGNSYYFFKMMRVKKINSHRVVFLSRKLTEVAEIIKEEGSGSSYHLLSFKGIWSFLRAKTVVLTHGPSDFFYYIGKRNLRKRIVNFWHTIPIKDMSGIAKGSNLTWDIQTVSSPWEKSLYENYGVKAKLVITGYPRNEYLIWAEKNQVELSRIKSKLDQYLQFTPSKIIVYAPTYRHHIGTDFFPFDDFNPQEILEFCKKHQIVILIRLHPNERESSSDSKLKKLLESKYFIFANRDKFSKMAELLLISDIVITDYSGSYFDFLLLNRPTIFLPYDRVEYNNLYGFAVNFDEVSQMTTCQNQAELLETIETIVNGSLEIVEFLAEQKEKYHQYDPENCSRNLVSYFN